MLDEVLKYNPDCLMVDSDEKTAVELAALRGLNVTEIVVKLFHTGCSRCDKYERLDKLKALTQRNHIDYYTVR